MTGQEHVVHRHVLELGLPSRGRAPAIQARARAAVDERLLPALDEALSARSRQDELIVIERLVLELGRLHEADFEAELARRFEEVLGPKIDDQLAALRRPGRRRRPRAGESGQFPGQVEGQAAGQVLTAGEARLQWLRAWLSRGAVPWGLPGANRLGPDAAPIVEALLDEHAGEVAALLRAANAPSTTQRLAFQLPAPLVDRLVEALEPARAAELLAVTEHCRKLLASPPAATGAPAATSGKAADGRTDGDRPVMVFDRTTAERLPSALLERLLAAPRGTVNAEQLAFELLEQAVGPPLRQAVIHRFERRARRLLPVTSPLRRALEHRVAGSARARQMDARTRSAQARQPTAGTSPAPAEHGADLATGETPGDAVVAPKTDRGGSAVPVAEGSGLVRDLDESGAADARKPAPPGREMRRAPASREPAPELRPAHSDAANVAPPAQSRLPTLAPPEAEALQVTDAGLALLAPFLPRLLRATGLLEGADFPSREARARAVLLLHHLATGRSDLPEARLVLDKTICTWPEGAPLPRRFEPSEQEKGECRRLLESVIGHWRALGRTSVGGLRSSFLERPGRLAPLQETPGWRLEVERASYDVLLEHLPWALSPIALPFMTAPIFVEW